MVAFIETGSPVLANTFFTNDQTNASITALDGGGFVVTWDDNSHEAFTSDPDDADQDGWGVMGQVFNAAGQKVGKEFLVNNATIDNQFHSSVAAIKGGFVTVWEDDKFDIDDPNHGVYFQRFNAKGKEVGQDIKVSGSGDATDADVTRLAGGGFVVTWAEDGDIFAQRVSKNGALQGGKILVNEGMITGNQSDPHVAALNTGGFAIVYDENNGGGGVIWRTFDANGDADPTIHSVSGVAANVDILVLADGDIVTTWHDIASAKIMGAYYDSLSETNLPLVFNIDVNPNDQITPSLAALAGGGFILVNDRNPGSIIGHYFPSGLDEETAYEPHDDVEYSNQLIGNFGGAPFEPAVAVLKNGDIVIAFSDPSSEGDDPDEGSVRFQILKSHNLIQRGGGADTEGGTKGRDLINGRAGDDTLGGGDGDDILVGDEGEDDLDGGKGSDTASYFTAGLGGVVASLFDPGFFNTGDAEGDTYKAIENLTGSQGGDTLMGDKKGNRLFGDAGDDTLRGYGGADLLDGGAQEDTAGYFDSFKAVVADLILGGSKGDAKGDRYVSIENILGSSGNDTLRGNAGANKLEGKDSNDVLEGRGGGDYLDGADGTDTVSFASAKSAVVAILYSNTFNTGDAFGDTYIDIENMQGSRFDDFLYGNSVNNRLSGGDGNDTLVGEEGDADILDGGKGSDTASYDDSPGVVASLLIPGNNEGEAEGDKYVSIENLTGSSYSDVLVGDNKANIIDGGGEYLGSNGIDALVGNGGDDKLSGGTEGDMLVGGAGKDTQTGGDGADTFRFQATGDSAVGKNRDVILDFKTSDGDIIDLSFIDAVKSTKGIDDEFVYIGPLGFGKNQPGVVRVKEDDEGLIVQGDINGDGKADFEIFVKGVFELLDTDFAL